MTPARAALIADILAAPCGSPELDERIAIELGWRENNPVPPPWTTSIDAALTLVPEGCQWLGGPNRLSPQEPLFGFIIYAADEATDCTGDEIGAAESHHALELAIVAAALKIGEWK